MNFFDAVFLGLAFLFVGRCWVLGKTRLRFFDGRLLYPMAGLSLCALFQMPFVQSAFRVNAGLYRIAQVACLALILSGKNFVRLSDRDARVFLKVFYYFSLLGAAIAVVYSLTTGRRFYGIWSVWFVFGSLAYGFYYSFYRLFFGKRRRWLEYAALFLFIWAIMLSRTRGLWLSIPLSIGLVVLIHHRHFGRFWRIRNIILLLICVVEICCIAAISGEIKARGASIFTGEQKRDARVYRWMTSLNVFLDHPWGVGFGNNRYYTLDYAIEESPDYAKVLKLRQGASEVTGPRYGAHSDWFTFLAEAGFAGVFLYAWFWIIILRDIICRRFRCVDTFIAATFLMTLFINTFLGNIFLASGGGMEVILFYYLTRRISSATESSGVLPAHARGQAYA